MSVSKTQIQEFVKQVDRVSTFAKTLNLDLLKLGTPEKPEAGFAFVHEDFTIKAIFEKKGIKWQTDTMSLQSYSVVDKLKKNKDFMYLYAFTINII